MYCSSISALLSLAPCFILFLLVFYDKLHCPAWLIVILIFVLTGFAVVLGHQLMDKMPEVIFWRAILTLFMVGICLFCCKMVITYSLAQTLFIVLLLRNYMDSVELFSSEAEYLYYGEFVNVSGYYANYIMKLGIILATAPLMWLFMKKVLKPVLENTKQLVFWKSIWLVPACFFVIYNLGPGYLEITYPGKMQIYLLPIAWTLCTFLSYFIILRMLYTTSCNHQLEEKIHISDVQMAAQEKQFEALEGNVERARRTRHDFRHSLRVIQNYAKENNGQAINDYLQGYIEELEDYKGQPVCENCAINAIIQSYKGYATENQVEMELSVDVPTKISFIEKDVCIILGNLMENAVEACTRSQLKIKNIKVKIRMTTPKLMIILVDNTYAGEIIQEKGVYASSKRAGNGIGIASICSLAEKYHGIAKFDYDGNLFHASVMLNGMEK
ncbi:MAG: ATP-binding protein [Lachnospiraceae bacterium]